MKNNITDTNINNYLNQIQPLSAHRGELEYMGVKAFFAIDAYKEMFAVISVKDIEKDQAINITKKISNYLLTEGFNDFPDLINNPVDIDLTEES